MKKIILFLFVFLVLTSCEKELASSPVKETEALSSENEPAVRSEGYPKYDETLSPNGKYILYSHSPFDTYKDGERGLMIGVSDIEGNLIHSITVDTIYSNDILGVEWINDSYFAVTCHVNPSTSEYFIYSMESGEESAYYNGYSFSVIDNSDVPKIMYAVNVPHDFGDKAYHSYAINGEVVYTSENMGATLSNVTVSKDKRKLAFVESFIYEEGKLPILVVMNVEGDELRLHSKTQLEENYGQFFFDEKNNVIFN